MTNTIIQFKDATVDQLRTAAKGCGFDEMAAKWENFVYNEAPQAKPAEVIKKLQSFGYTHLVLKDRFLTVGK